MNRQQRRAAERQHKRTFHACKRGNLATAAMMADQAGQPGTAELFRAAMQGNLGLAVITKRDVKVSAADLQRGDDAVLTLIGDDDYQSTGPRGWACASAVAAWAKCAVIHAAGASAETYREAILGARVKGAAVLVETNTANAKAWADLFAGKPTLLVLSRAGDHPIQPAAGDVH
jgi:hypothetical protein